MVVRELLELEIYVRSVAGVLNTNKMNPNFSTFGLSNRPVVATVHIPIEGQKDHVLNFYVDPTQDQVIEAINNLASRAHRAFQHELFSACIDLLMKYMGAKIPVHYENVKTRAIDIPLPKGPAVLLPSVITLCLMTDKQVTDEYIIEQLQRSIADIRSRKFVLGGTPVQMDVIVSGLLDEIVRRKNELYKKTNPYLFTANGERKVHGKTYTDEAKTKASVVSAVNDHAKEKDAADLKSKTNPDVTKNGRPYTEKEKELMWNDRRDYTNEEVQNLVYGAYKQGAIDQINAASRGAIIYAEDEAKKYFAIYRKG